MRLRSLSVGKPRGSAWIHLHDDYATRLKRLGATYESSWVRDAGSGRRSDGEILSLEAQGLLERLDREDSGVIALDRRGRGWTSAALARWLERRGNHRVTFVIGGPLGLHPSVVERAERSWSLSELTFPHELVRVLLVEQLYRAATILRGVPYHK